MNCPNKVLLSLLITAFWLLSCQRERTTENAAEVFQQQQGPEPVSEVRFAGGFDLIQKGDITKLLVYDPYNKGEVLMSLYLADAKTAEKYGYPKGLLIVPLDSVAVFSTTQINAMKNLGLLQKVVGVSEADYILDEEVRQGLDEGRIVELAGNGNFYVERALQLNPSVIFHSPYQANQNNPLAATKIPMIPFLDFLEPTPLGRAEWLKFTAVFFGKKAEADKQFEAIVQEYNKLKELAAGEKQRPTVFSDKYFSGQWYLPGGKSYIATLFRDAGADYIWDDDTHGASFPLDYETVFSKAHDADFWRIVGSFGDEASYEGLANENELYTHFKAFQDRHILWCDAQKTAYFEKSSLEPQVVLADFIKAFHPQLLPAYQPKYYEILP